jgi:uncharacterized protein YktB (UPF0637 family)
MHKDLSDDELHQAIDRVKHVKKGEFFVARTLSPNDSPFLTCFTRSIAWCNSSSLKSLMYDFSGFI